MTRARLIERALLLAATVSGLSTVSIFVFMVILGLPILTAGHFSELLTGPWSPDHGVYGIRSMIVGSLTISFLSLLFAFPLSLGTSVFIAVLAPRGVALAMKRLVRFMTAIPTVVYGFVGIFLLVPIIRELFVHGSGMSILTAALLLAILISPTMILIFVDSFERVPRSYLTAVAALGGSRIDKLIHVILPCSWPGIVTGLVLALGRAMGDTMISLMVAGNSVGLPQSILDSSRTLTGHIGLIIAADFDSLEFKALFACGLLLYLMTSIMVVIIRSLHFRAGVRGW